MAPQPRSEILRHLARGLGFLTAVQRAEYCGSQTGGLSLWSRAEVPAAHGQARLSRHRARSARIEQRRGLDAHAHYSGRTRIQIIPRGHDGAIAADAAHL